MNIIMKLIKLLKRVKRFCDRLNFNYLKTISINFRLLPLSQALRLPIVIYSPCELLVRRSRLKFEADTPIKFGMIALGRNDDMMVSSKYPLLLMILDSTIITSGNFRMSPGCTLRMDHGKLKLGKYVHIGGGTKLICNSEISIGDYSGLAFNCVCCDTDFHFISVDGKVKNCVAPIIIGDRVWIGNNSTVAKGAVLPSSAIFGSRSLANKDYSSFGREALLAGAPAKYIRNNCHRVQNLIIESSLKKYFADNKGPYLMSQEELLKSQNV